MRAGYDRISTGYRDDDGGDGDAHDYRGWIDALGAVVPAGGRVLDLGCGCGVPAGRLLAERGYTVVGVDFSTVQLRRARQLVPEVRLVLADMGSVAFAPAAFDAIVAFYSIIHVPLEEQPSLFRSIAGWLRPGGTFMATLGWGAWTGTEEDWLDLGATMYWSHADAETYRRWLTAAGLDAGPPRFVAEGSGGHALFVARAAA